MNQILLTDDSNINESSFNNYSGNNYTPQKPSSPIDIQKIIIIFGAIVIIFGLAIAGFYGFKALSNKGNTAQPGTNPETKPQDIALEEVDLTEVGDEETNQKKEVEVNTQGIEVSKVVYAWNDAEEKEITANAEGKISIPVPAGTNELTVKVTDQTGEETVLRHTYTVLNDEQKPKIETSIVDGGNLKVVASSTIPMKYIKYSWENEDEVTIKPETAESEKIETVVEVKRGKNKIKIVAVDLNENSDVYEKTFNGVNKPEIKVTKKGDKVHMKISHDKGFKSVTFSINGRVVTYDANIEAYDPEQKLLEYYFKLKSGENIILIKAISNEDSEESYKGKCQYTPPAQ